mmetsp:Transcript_1841/g.2869  ORF Transcript_1841/g.2869 Transcript_1841/m.2869 type:complete len:329 (+) Transcript_1841:327-1313(+)
MTIGTSYDSSSAPLDRMDAAHVLLGVSPKTVIGPLYAAMSKNTAPTSYTAPIAERPRSAPSSGGLDALASLAASMEQSRVTFSPSCAISSSSDDDSEAMPPPPPRRRERSCSNPEGMEKWDSLNRISERRRFVLPTSILEEELAEAKIAADRKNEQDRLLQQEISVTHSSSPFGCFRDEEAFVSPEELLRRARSRLLEDLSEGSITGEKGQLTLPHSLGKYKHVYNKNGRIGIYTPAERAAIISRFQSKRSRRVWNKKIRYNCRKNLADRRLRVKGRFVKRAVAAKAAAKPVVASAVDNDMPDVNDPEAGFCPTEDQPFRRTRRHTIT